MDSLSFVRAACEYLPFASLNDLDHQSLFWFPLHSCKQSIGAISIKLIYRFTHGIYGSAQLAYCIYLWHLPVSKRKTIVLRTAYWRGILPGLLGREGSDSPRW